MTTSTKPRRVLTPLDKNKTERAANIRTGCVQTWAATSKDGRWCYVRTEERGTPWRVTDLTTHQDTNELFGSLGAARAWTALPEVADNPAYAWRNLSEPHPVLDQLPADFVHDYRAALDQAAVVAMATTLRWAWERGGYRMVIVTPGQMADANRELSDQSYWGRWDRAARWINPLTLVDNAKLTDELHRYLDPVGVR